MANTLRPVLRELSLASTSSLHTKASSSSEQEVKHSHTGQDPSLLGCTPVQEPDECWPFQQDFFPGGVLLHSCVPQRWCQQETVHCGSRGTEEGSAGPEEQNWLSSPPAQGEMAKLSSPPWPSPAGDEGCQGPPGVPGDRDWPWLFSCLTKH